MAHGAFISTTIPYVNARPHVGHALEYVQADAFARSMRQRGADVFFLSGSDENSLKNVLAAEREGISTQELVDRNVVYFQELLAALGAECSAFIRTSADADHHAGAVEIWRRMKEQGDIYAKEYEGLYCVGCEQFYTEAELVDGKCPEHHVEPELVSERNYFFRLSRYGGQLVAALEDGRITVTPESRRNETLGFIRSGLEDISISRSMDRARGWGIAVPDDPTQVMYVWIDALTNYVNALGWTRDDEKYERYWRDADRRIHVVGKGVLRFHAVYWPAMLISAGLPLPTDVMVHGYITNAGQKLSKTLGNSVEPMDLVARYGQDAVRYYLLADFSPFGDGDFNEERLVGRYNADLANGIGNLVSRITAMLVRYRDGVVPPVGTRDDSTRQLADELDAAARDVAGAMDRFDHREALARIGEVIRRSNAYVDEHAPWHLAKQAAAGEAAAAQELDMVLRAVLDTIRGIGALLAPFVPAASARILTALGEPLPAPFPATGAVGDQEWAGPDLTGRVLQKGDPVLPRLEG